LARWLLQLVKEKWSQVKNVRDNLHGKDFSELQVNKENLPVLISIKKGQTK
jgi:hypothetical protein